MSSSKSTFRFRPAYAIAALALFALELTIATRWRHVPFVRADLGDYLVVILLFTMVKAVWNLSPRRLAFGIFVFACGVEGVQALALADRLGLARGSWPSIVIGTHFAWSDLAMYLAGCLTAWLLGSRLEPATANRP
jgi:Protein of unknown function (DUF2809)